MKTPLFSKNMTNKYILMVGLVVVVAAFGLVNFSNSALSPGKYIIENFSGNFYDSGDNSIEVAEDENLGAIEFNTGKVVFSELAESVLQRRQVVVSAAQVDNLRNVPIVLNPAVGDNNVTIVDSIVGFRRFSSESWSRNYVGDSFEVKWGDNQVASGSVPGMVNSVALGASFSQGFLTGGRFNTTASPEIEIWRPSVAASLSNSFSSVVQAQSPIFASSSAVYLTGAINPNNVETSGITDFVFEVVYRIFPRP